MSKKAETKRNITTSSVSLAKNIIKHCYKASQHKKYTIRVTPFLWGHKSSGKSALVEQCANELGINFMPVFTSSFDSPGDLAGLPEKNTVEVGNKVVRNTTNLVPDWFPSEENEPILGPRGILFFDEWNRANQHILQMTLQISLYGAAGRHRMMPGWILVGAGNPRDGQYMVRTFDEALIDRLLHISVCPTREEWAEWSAKAEIDEGIRAFVLRNEAGQAVTDNGEVNLEFTISPTKRSWELLNNLFTPELAENTELLLPIAMGLVGMDAAVAFVSSLRDKANILIESRLIMTNAAKASAQFDKLVKLQRIDCIEVSHLLLATQFAHEAGQSTITDEVIENIVGYVAHVHKKDKALVTGLLNHISRIISNANATSYASYQKLIDGKAKNGVQYIEIIKTLWDGIDPKIVEQIKTAS